MALSKINVSEIVINWNIANWEILTSSLLWVILWSNTI